MWCEHCQTDVATQISDDAQSLLCTTCGQSVKKIFAPSLHPETKSAREILERWALEQQSRKSSQSGNGARATETSNDASSEGKKPAESAAAASKTRTSKDESRVEDSSERNTEMAEADLPDTPAPTRKGARHRVDSGHSAPTGPARAPGERKRRPHALERLETAAEAEPELSAAVPAPKSQPAPEQKRPSKVRIDAGHQLSPDPHFDVRTATRRTTLMPGRSETVWGQLLAYGGVGLLTVGTVLVLWGYFGEIEKYASTGWLLATAGQMLLLLGIVTLVSGGMQQTTHEVSQRIEHLGGRIIRIEQSTEKILKGPHFGRRKRRERTNGMNAGNEQDVA